MKGDLVVEPPAKACNCKLLLPSGEYKRGVAWTGDSDSASCHITMDFFELRLKVLRNLADLHLYDSVFQTEGALTLNAFADSASAIRGTVSNGLRKVSF